MATGTVLYSQTQFGLMPRFIFALDSSALTAIALIWAPDLQLGFAVEHIRYIVNSKLVCIFVAFI